MTQKYLNCWKEKDVTKHNHFGRLHSEVRKKSEVDASLRLKGRPKEVLQSEKWKTDRDKKIQSI